MDKYERLVFSITLNYGVSREDAADIAQVTFTALIQNLDTLPDDSRLGACLATVARRHTWRLMERNRREGPIRERDLAETAALLGKEDAGSLERWELSQWLNQCPSVIDGHCKRLLLALYFDSQGLSYAEVANRLSMPVGSVGPTRSRCLERLKRALTQG